MRLRSLKDVAPEPSVAACVLPECVTPTERVWTVHGKRLCVNCNWELLLYLVAIGEAGPAIQKEKDWRAAEVPELAFAKWFGRQAATNG